MLLPAQQTAGLAATNMMQSMLDGIEDRRREDQEKASGKKADPVLQAKISASTEARRAREKIAEALFGANNSDPNELKIKLVERLAAKLGVDIEEDRSSYSLGKALEDIVKDLDPSQVSKLEDDLGLSQAGVSLATLIASIKNPYGDDNSRLMAGLEKQANGGKNLGDVDRALQRLEDVADPKTLEELKLGPQGSDPTRIEDKQTRAERQDDIRSLEASAKLEDVQDMQDAIEERNDEAAGTTSDAEVSHTDDAELLVVLAAAAEQMPETVESEDVAGVEAESPATNNASLTDDSKKTEVNAKAVEDIDAERAAVQQDILPVSSDEIGIYELLKKKLAA